MRAVCHSFLCWRVHAYRSRAVFPGPAWVLGWVVAREQVAYVAACVAVIFGSLCYMLCDFAGWPLLVYEPYERIWMVAAEPPSVASMLFPGMLLWGLCGALLGAASSLVILSKRTKPLPQSAITLLGAWAASSTAFTAMYFLWGLWPF